MALGINPNKHPARVTDEVLLFADDFVTQPVQLVMHRLGLSAEQAQAWQTIVAELAAAVRGQRRTPRPR